MNTETGGYFKVSKGAPHVILGMCLGNKDEPIKPGQSFGNSTSTCIPHQRHTHTREHKHVPVRSIHICGWPCTHARHLFVSIKHCGVLQARSTRSR